MNGRTLGRLDLGFLYTGSLPLSYTPPLVFFSLLALLDTKLPQAGLKLTL